MKEAPGRELALQIISRLRQRGHQAWLVGGCVRDELLGISPADYDVATSALPQEILDLFPNARLVGAHFGVVLVDSGAVSVEVATFRSDHSYRDGRRPEAVIFETDPRQDALRRDFTINGLFLDPFDGSVLDYVGGQEDLRAGVVRAIGDPAVRFAEDHLRMLRGVRLAARYGFRIEEGTFRAIRQHRHLILKVSAERIRDELVRILIEGGARRGMELLDACGLLEEILPEVKAFQGVEQPPEYHPEGDVWTHVLLMLEAMAAPTPTLALGVLLHDVGKPVTFRRVERIRFDGHVEAGVALARDILSRLRFSTDTISRVVDLVAQHLRFKDIQKMKPSTLKRFLRLPHFDEHLELHRLDCLASHGNLDNYAFAKQMFEQTPAEELRPPRLLTGHDLIALGYEPGPQFGRLLRAVEDAQLEGKIRTREEALALVAQLERPETNGAARRPGAQPPP